MTVRYDDDRKAWIVDNVTEISGTMFNNLLKWGQPYTPYDTGLFRHDIYDAGLDRLPTVISNNKDVLSNGFGKYVRLTNFDIVKRLKKFEVDLPDGVYSLKKLQDLGLSRLGSRPEDGGRFGDHAMPSNLYWKRYHVGLSNDLPWPEAAYVFGSVRFQMSDDTVFKFRDGKLHGVKGNIEIQEDNFDHRSYNIPPLASTIIHGAVGDDQNYDHVKMLFEGPGKELTFGNFDPGKNIGKVQGQSNSLGSQQQPSLQLDPTVHRLLSGDLSALDPEGRSRRTSCAC